MSKVFILLFAVLLLNCDQKDESSPLIEENYEWLLGKWQRLDDNDQRDTYEHWQKESESLYLGHRFIMQQADTIWQERMRFEYADSTWVMEIVTPGNDDMVPFTLSGYSTDAFTVENPNHDFPKAINYVKTENGMKALVSGEEMEIVFEFVRVE